jgi:large subunit ribosomal protein L31
LRNRYARIVQEFSDDDRRSITVLVCTAIGWQTGRSARDALINHPAPVHARPHRDRRPGGHSKGTSEMREGIHPEYVVTEVTCSCGETFTTRSTAKSGSLHADVCSACHPFYTGKQKIMDVGGRIDKFEKRYGKRQRTS